MQEGATDRVVAALSGAVLLAAAIAGGVLTLFLAFLVRSPDAAEPDYGDPCCPRPDTWLETAGWAVVGLGAAAVVGLVAAAGVALLIRAATGRGVRARSLLHGPGWAAVVAVAVMGFAVVSSLGD